MMVLYHLALGLFVVFAAFSLPPFLDTPCALAQAGAAPELIKAAGRWSSDAFERYIRKNPMLMHALILGRSSAFDGPS